jgi:hypothetical protein
MAHRSAAHFGQKWSSDALYFKMANMWEHAALRFENGYETKWHTSERDEIEGNQET